MNEQAKFERLLRLMQYLSGTVNYSVQNIAERLDISTRTVYRYLQTLKDAGFMVNKISGDIYKLGKMPKHTVDIKNLIYFSDEEAVLVNGLIDSLDPTNSLKANLKAKLSAVCKELPITDYVSRRSNAEHVADLREAIEGKKQAKLSSYESGHSNTVRDRMVEPFGFTTNYVDVIAYDVEDGKNKIFKISRIGIVKVLDKEWEHEDSHRNLDRDLFRISGDSSIHVKLGLSFLAKNLLEEEFPLADKAIRQEEGRWILDTVVHSLKGVGRFVAGLMDEVEVLEGEELRDYLREYGKNFITI